MATSKRKRRSSNEDDNLTSKLRHFDTFYGKAPPGLIKKREERPEDSIPDRPENRNARQFLANAPTKGLWMPLGKEVKVMKCWRCKAYGHRTGDRECPLFKKGNAVIENFRVTHEDPMHDYILKNRMKKKEERIKQLQALLDSSTTDTEDSDVDAKSSDHRHRRKRQKNMSSKREHRIPKDKTEKTNILEKKKHRDKRKSKHKRKHKHKTKN
ncbi:retinitis pigmentosa 9 protein-like [Glandiceps talaboti]